MYAAGQSSGLEAPAYSIQTRSRSAAASAAQASAKCAANTIKDMATSTPAASRSKKVNLQNSQVDRQHEIAKPSPPCKRKRVNSSEAACDMALAKKTAGHKASSSNLVSKSSHPARVKGPQSKEQEDTNMTDASTISAAKTNKAASAKAAKKKAAAKKGKAQGRAPWH